MIEVNLLPIELRKVEHTPMPRFLVIAAGTALVMATAAYGVVVNLRTVPDLMGKEQEAVKEIAIRQPMAKDWDELQDEISDARVRKQAIAELWRTRIQWSRRLAQLAEVTPGFVGFTEVKLEEARSGGAKDVETGGMLTVQCLLAGSDLNRVAMWRRIAEGGENIIGFEKVDVAMDFKGSFMPILPTETTLVEVKEDYMEKQALKLDLKMPVKPASARLAEATAAEQAEMAKKAAEARPASNVPAKRGRKASPEPAKEEAATAVPASVAAPKAAEDDAADRAH
jgi:Tfp pilus assembly protein PilN